MAHARGRVQGPAAARRRLTASPAFAPPPPSAELTSNLTLYNENTKRDEANILVKATLIAETTNQLVEGIRANTSLIVAAADVTLQRIDSESASDVERLVQAANADAESIRANAIANIFEQFTSEIGFTPTVRPLLRPHPHAYVAMLTPAPRPRGRAARTSTRWSGRR